MIIKTFLEEKKKKKEKKKKIKIKKYNIAHLIRLS